MAEGGADYDDDAAPSMMDTTSPVRPGAQRFSVVRRPPAPTPAPSAPSKPRAPAAKKRAAATTSRKPAAKQQQQQPPPPPPQPEPPQEEEEENDDDNEHSSEANKDASSNDNAEIMAKMRSFLEREELKYQAKMAANLGAAARPMRVDGEAPPDPKDPQYREKLQQYYSGRDALRRDGYYNAKSTDPKPSSFENSTNHYDRRWIGKRVQDLDELSRNPWYVAAEAIAGMMGREAEYYLKGPIPAIHTAEDVAEEKLRRFEEQTAAAATTAASNNLPPPLPIPTGSNSTPLPQSSFDNSPFRLNTRLPQPPHVPGSEVLKPHTQWLNQPENNGFQMYKAVLKAAMRTSLDEIGEWLQTRDINLLEVITHPQISGMFFRLVYQNLRQTAVGAPTRNESPAIMLPDIAKRKRALKYEWQTRVYVDSRTGKLAHMLDGPVARKRRLEEIRQAQSVGTIPVARRIDEQPEVLLYTPRISYEEQRDSMPSGPAQEALDRHREFFHTFL